MKGYWTDSCFMGYIPGKGYMKFENDTEYALYWRAALIENNGVYGIEHVNKYCEHDINKATQELFQHAGDK